MTDASSTTERHMFARSRLLDRRTLLYGHASRVLRQALIFTLAVLVGAACADCRAADLPKPILWTIVNGHTVYIDIKLGKFDPKKHPIATQQYPGGSRIVVSGKPIVGTTNSKLAQLSRRSDAVIDRISLRWDDRVVPVSTELFDHVFFPSLRTSFSRGNPPDLMFSVDPAGEAMIVRMKAGQGPQSQYVNWLLRRNGKHQLIDDSFFGLRP